MPQQSDPDAANRDALWSEFERAAGAFAERTQGRFDDLDVVSFAGARPGESVLEVGAGTGNFLALFAGAGRRLIAADLTHGMLLVARSRYEDMAPLVADGRKLPLASRSIDLVTTAQMLHHVWKPVPILQEMRRVVAPSGRVLIVDQVATDRYEEAMVRNELERIRDPSHAVSRPPSALRLVVQAAGLEIVDERIVEGEQRLSRWMWPGEFPEDRIESVRDFIESRGGDTGMDFRRDGDDWVFTRRRMMILARRA